MDVKYISNCVNCAKILDMLDMHAEPVNPGLRKRTRAPSDLHAKRVGTLTSTAVDTAGLNKEASWTTPFASTSKRRIWAFLCVVALACRATPVGGELGQEARRPEVRSAFVVGALEGVILPDPAPDDAPPTVTTEAELNELGGGRWVAPVLYGGLG